MSIGSSGGRRPFLESASFVPVLLVNPGADEIVGTAEFGLDLGLCNALIVRSSDQVLNELFNRLPSTSWTELFVCMDAVLQPKIDELSNGRHVLDFQADPRSNELATLR
jgi:hypothetical protein